MEAIDKWAAATDTIRSNAVRWLLELGLAAGTPRQHARQSRKALVFIDESGEPMKSINARIPEVDVMLALPPEELGLELLQVLNVVKDKNGIFHPNNLRGAVLGFVSRPTPDGALPYPDKFEEEAELALAEAFNWLQAAGMIVPRPGDNAGWRVLSRTAKRLIGEGDFDGFRVGLDFPKSMLHPTIANDVWIALARGELDVAVFRAFKAVEEAVREAGRYDATDYGTDLMRKAFHATNGRLTNRSQPTAEREALAHLFTGAIGSYENPHSHRTVAINDAAEAREMVVLASHLLRIVDGRRHSASTPTGRLMPSEEGKP